MYVVEDRLTPTMSTYIHGRRTKEIFLKYFPTVMEDGVKVFSRLYMYNGHIVRSTANDKIYHLLNVKMTDVEKQSYKGIRSVWIYLKPVKTKTDPLDSLDTSDYCLKHKDIEKRTITLYYKANSTDSKLSKVTDVEILDLLKSNPTTFQYTDTTDDYLSSFALLDVSNIVFETTAVVKKRDLIVQDGYSSTYSNNGIGTKSYELSAVVEVSYKIKSAASFNSSLPIYTLFADKVNIVEDYRHGTALDFTPRTISGISGSGGRNTSTRALTDLKIDQSMGTSINKYLYELYINIKPFTDSELYSQYGSVKYDGLKNLPVKYFSQALGQLVATDYQEKEAEWWQTLLVAVLTIVIIVAAVYTGGAAAAAANGVAASIGAFAMQAGIVLTIGMLGMTGVQMVAANNKMYGLTNQIGNSIKIIGIVATVIAIVGIATAVYKIGQKLLEESVKKSLWESLKDYTSSAIDGFIDAAKHKTSEFLLSMVNMLNMGFSVYAKYINPPNKGIDDRQDEVNRQQQELEDYSSADMINRVERYMSSPYANPYDMNAYMEYMPHEMTTGMIEGTFNKYYDN